ncbi:Phosphatidylinositol-4-phosphate 5-kinase and related FYVE finger-containing proteins [Scheffersomyces stipitis CBS 6054]|uniref:Phosphatidylinositol-4-phosphate 5-kinase and related FYVE finger-containing proteins n=1 Tax=Scheffersomyces stipitis (strain ATCC 58785 / CBS 6054 / NBRC 10063 / NRRL Y-11545) TaxID=322104 RepID=A3LUB7_PICST|nr:Phosphatidylinositol-4-phosphate 5-kinase and related FYVE finger-containing proteins [Scheffersomyces stipitis CBS 6054]ABN66559.2 Phosphatidylinositol-4-phosphate 5-kinase and related FYVE finger-containing proteins [Scheffersomyces stipitis CBS 6054]
MTASAIQKRFSQMSVSHKKVPVEETEESNSEFIKSINYDSLEKKYDIHKYYPSYIHNCGISTPVLRDLIIDKPIYADANKHVKKKKKRSSARDGRSTRRLEQVQELRELKKDQLQDRKDLRKEMRDLKKSQKTEVQEIKRKYKGRISQNIQEIKHNNKLMNDGSKEPNGRKISSVRNNSVGNVNPYEIGTSFSNFVDTSDETEVDEEDFLDLGYNNKEGLEGHFGMFEETKFRDPFNTFTIEKVSSAMNTLNNSNSNSNSMNSTIYLNNTNNNGHHYHNSVSHSTAASALSGSTKRNSSITGKFMKMMKGGSISSESSNDDGLISRNNTNIPFTHVLSKNSTNNSNNLSKNNSNTNGSHDHKNSYGGRNPGEPPLNPLSKAQSYDQTRSHMTNKRQNIKEKFLKLKINGERRHSDQIGMYITILLTDKIETKVK